MSIYWNWTYSKSRPKINVGIFGIWIKKIEYCQKFSYKIKEKQDDYFHLQMLERWTKIHNIVLVLVNELNMKSKKSVSILYNICWVSFET